MSADFLFCSRVWNLQPVLPFGNSRVLRVLTRHVWVIFYTVCCLMVVITFSQQIRAQWCCSWSISVYMNIKMQVHKFWNREHIEWNTNRWIEHWPENMFGILLRTGMAVSKHFLLFTRHGSANWLVFLSLRPITLNDEVMNSRKSQWKEVQDRMNSLDSSDTGYVCMLESLVGT